MPAPEVPALVQEGARAATEVIRKSKEGATIGNLGSVRRAVSIYYAEAEGRYPGDLAALIFVTTDEPYIFISIVWLALAAVTLTRRVSIEIAENHSRYRKGLVLYDAEWNEPAFDAGAMCVSATDKREAPAAYSSSCAFRPTISRLMLSAIADLGTGGLATNARAPSSR